MKSMYVHRLQLFTTRMVSDSLITINQFVTPVALSSLWILATYYCAQMLIVHNARLTRS